MEVIDHRVCLLKASAALHGEEADVSGACAHQIYFSLILFMVQFMFFLSPASSKWAGIIPAYYNCPAIWHATLAVMCMVIRRD